MDLPKVRFRSPAFRERLPQLPCAGDATASAIGNPPPVTPPASVEPARTVTPQAPASAPVNPPPVVIAPPPSFSAAGTPAPAPKASTMSPALVALISAVGIVALLAILYLFVLPKGTARTPAVTMEKPGVTRPNIATAHPLAKYIEVTGLRIAEGGPGQAKIIFAAVNHSAADLPELDAHMTLTGAGQTIFEFPVSVPSLGPYESKDITTTVKTNLKPYEMPDWQTLTPALRILSEH